VPCGAAGAGAYPHSTVGGAHAGAAGPGGEGVHGSGQGTEGDLMRHRSTQGTHLPSAFPWSVCILSAQLFAGVAGRQRVGLDDGTASRDWWPVGPSTTHESGPSPPTQVFPQGGSQMRIRTLLAVAAARLLAP